MKEHKMDLHDWEVALNRYLEGETARSIYNFYLEAGFKSPRGKKLNFNAFSAKLCKLKKRAATRPRNPVDQAVAFAAKTEAVKETILTPDLIAEFVWKGLASEQKQKLIASHITKTLGA